MEPRPIWGQIGLGVLSLAAPPTLIFCVLAISHAIGHTSIPPFTIEIAVLVGLICLLRLPMPVFLRVLIALIYAPMMWYMMMLFALYVALILGLGPFP